MEIAHIEPRKRDGSNDTFENLIALCPTCHTRYDRDEIDRPSMRHYKANLATLNSRYGEMERRLLDQFAADPGADFMDAPRDMDFDFMYLLQDGLLAKTTRGPRMAIGNIFVAGMTRYSLTLKGKEFVSRWAHGQPMEEG